MDSAWSNLVLFREVAWPEVPDVPGVYAVFDEHEFLYVGMAGRNGKGSLRRRLKAHRDGNLANMLKQYLWFGIVQHRDEVPADTPAEASARCREYMMRNLAFRHRTCDDAGAARELENKLKRGESPWGKPQLNAAC